MYKPVTYDEYVYPAWAEIMGLLISGASMMWVPIYAVYYIATAPGNSLREVQNSILFFLMPLLIKEICLTAGM